MALIGLRRRYPPTSAMVTFNRNVIDAALGQPGVGLRRSEIGYRARLVANRSHLARTRIALLAAAHSERTRAADLFERFVRLSTAA